MRNWILALVAIGIMIAAYPVVSRYTHERHVFMRECLQEQGRDHCAALWNYR